MRSCSLKEPAAGVRVLLRALKEITLKLMFSRLAACSAAIQPATTGIEPKNFVSE